MRLQVFILMGMTLVLLASCSPREGAYEAQRHRGYQVPMNNAGILSETLSEVIAVEATNSRRTASNTLEVWAEVRNRETSRRSIAVRARFYDKNRAPIETTRWSPMFVAPLSVTTYKTAATDLDAVYYYVEIREAE